MTDWDQVEIDYRCGMEINKLAHKHTLSVMEIKEHAEAEGWLEESYWGNGVHPRYVAFVDEYLVDWDAAAAAKRCGLGHLVHPRSLLHNPSVSKLLKERMVARQQRTQITHDSVLAMLYLIATSDVRKMYREDGTLKPVHELDDATAFALSAVDVDEQIVGGTEQLKTRTTKVKLLDKLAALRDIGKHIGMYNEKIELSGRAGGPIETKDVSTEDVARRIAFLFTKTATEKDTPK